MNNQDDSVGKRGEDLAAKFLRKASYITLERNYRLRGGEIDIIARAPDGTLVFVEVKTLAQESPTRLRPEDHVTSAKLKKMRRAAELFANGRPELVRESRGWRIDVVTVVLANPPVVRRYENV